jgi:hypothetical protein
MITCAQLLFPRLVADAIAPLVGIPCTGTAATAALAAPCVVVEAPKMEMKGPALAVLTLTIETRYRPDLDDVDTVCGYHDSAQGAFQQEIGKAISAAAQAVGLTVRKALLTGSAHNTEGAERQSQLTAQWRVEISAF